MVQRGGNNYWTMKQTLNIKQLACQNWQTGVDDAARTENIHSSATVAYQNKQYIDTNNIIT